jgi:predicted nucleotidyltransferase
MNTDFEGLFRALVDHRVEFVVIGGLAAVAHGSARATADLDIVPERSDENLARLVAALGGHSPYLRGAPAGLPFRLDVDTLKAGLNFTLTTDLGSIDLLGEVVGGGRYAALEPDAVRIELFGLPVRIASLERLIAMKRAAGRPKDLEAIAELEALRLCSHEDSP